MSAFEDAQYGQCGSCGRRSLYDPCPKCAAADRVAEYVVRNAPLDDFRPIGLVRDGRDEVPTWSEWPLRRPADGPRCKGNHSHAGYCIEHGVGEDRRDPFANVHLPTPDDIRRALACYWDDENEWASRMVRRQGSRWCAMHGVDPFGRGDA